MGALAERRGSARPGKQGARQEQGISGARSAHQRPERGPDPGAHQADERADPAGAGVFRRHRGRPAVTGGDALILALTGAALVLVLVELAAQRRYVLAWAVGLLALAELVRQLA